MRIKDSSVKIGGFKPQIVMALLIIDKVYQKYGVEAVITRGTESVKGQHPQSKHPNGEGVDLRSREIKYGVFTMSSEAELIERFLRDVRENIGPEYDFIFERNPDHFHLEVH